MLVRTSSVWGFCGTAPPGGLGRCCCSGGTWHKDKRLYNLCCDCVYIICILTTVETNLMFRWKQPGVFVAVNTEAALSWSPDQPWVGAGWWSWWQLVATERSAAHCSIDAGTLVFAAGKEGLTILVDLAVVLTWASLWFGWTEKQDNICSALDAKTSFQ